MEKKTSDILLEIFQIMNVFFPSIPFLFQIRTFYTNKSSVGFSKKTSLIIITSSILRVFFWFGKHFHWSLLAQSILLIITQILVISSAIRFGEEKKKENSEPSESSDKIDDSIVKNNFHPKSKINGTIYYIAFIILLVLTLEILSVTLTFQNQIYVEVLGTFSSIIEAALVIPQIIENFRVKTTANLSNVLVGCWVFGDSMKTFYYYISEAPIQLLISGAVQIFLDFIVIFQICIYRKNPVDEQINKTLINN